MKVTFWGVRGSIPSPGAHTTRYGGNTSCVEVQTEGAPPVVFDCGTGARDLGRSIVLRHERKVELLLSHFHMDHLFGFPFFGPLFSPSCEVSITLPATNAEEAESRLSRYLNGVFHPLRLRDIHGSMKLSHIRPGRSFERSGYEFTAVRLNHPGGSCGYRVQMGDRSVVYMTDTAPMTRLDEGLSARRAPPPGEARVIEAMRDADLVIFDAMFTFQEYLEKMTWGHCYPEYAVALAEAASAKRLALFHHSPDADDDELDELADTWGKHAGLDVFVAREGAVVDLSG